VTEASLATPAGRQRWLRPRAVQESQHIGQSGRPCSLVVDHAQSQVTSDVTLRRLECGALRNHARRCGVIAPMQVTLATIRIATVPESVHFARNGTMSIGYRRHIRSQAGCPHVYLKTCPQFLQQNRRRTGTSGKPATSHVRTAARFQRESGTTLRPPQRGQPALSAVVWASAKSTPDEP
jgi:hypothetical protein